MNKTLIPTSPQPAHTPQNLRACISALLADEDRGCSNAHLDLFLFDLANAANTHAANEAKIAALVKTVEQADQTVKLLKDVTSLANINKDTRAMLIEAGNRLNSSVKSSRAALALART